MTTTSSSTSSPARLPAQTIAVKGSLASQPDVTRAGVDGVKADPPGGGRRVVDGIKHGLTGYCSHGCRCATCTGAMVFNYKKLRVARARGGPLLVEKRSTFNVLTYLIEAGFTLAEVDARAGVGEGYCANLRSDGRSRKMHRFKREAIFRAVRQMADERRAALADLESALDFAEGRQPRRIVGEQTWPTSLLMDAIDRKYGTPEERERLGNEDGRRIPWPNDADRRYVYRSEVLDTSRAERLCAALGFYPEDVWPDWFQLGETA